MSEWRGRKREQAGMCSKLSPYCKSTGNTCTSFCYLKSLEEELKVTRSECDSGKERASELEQKVDDLAQDVKIAEKKSSALVGGLCLVIFLLSDSPPPPPPPPLSLPSFYCPFVLLFR